MVATPKPSPKPTTPMIAPVRLWLTSGSAAAARAWAANTAATTVVGRIRRCRPLFAFVERDRLLDVRPGD
jgi:hypothetical protein